MFRKPRCRAHNRISPRLPFALFFSFSRALSVFFYFLFFARESNPLLWWVANTKDKQQQKNEGGRGGGDTPFAFMPLSVWLIASIVGWLLFMPCVIAFWYYYKWEITLSHYRWTINKGWSSLSFSHSLFGRPCARDERLKKKPHTRTHSLMSCLANLNCTQAGEIQCVGMPIMSVSGWDTLSAF